MATAVASAAPAVISHPPASPFAELLRRSRFATFDTAIRQAYSAPSAYAHRGNWGLKRPIALRRRNAFITLTSFESPAQYIEWNNAESQVRFIRRVEEMGTQPRVAHGTPWSKSLGKAKTQWLIDSEFCPGEGHLMDAVQPAQESVVNIDELGKKGPGQYGAHRQSPLRQQDTHITPNIDAMSRRDFARYLEKLRQLRPAFQAHIKKHAKKNPQAAGKSLYALAQNAEAGYHRTFLAEHTAKEFESLESHKIAQQPHPNAALIYHHPSVLDTFFTAKAQPGLVLQAVVEANTSRYTRSSAPKEPLFIASFGGLTATLKKSNAGGKTPLLDLESEQGVEQSEVEDSVARMRVVPRGIVLETPPKVVGRNAQGLKAVRIKAQVTTDVEYAQFGRDNPHWPGTTEYNAEKPLPTKSLPTGFTFRPPQRAARISHVSQQKRRNNDKIIGTLQAMVVGKSGGARRV